MQIDFKALEQALAPIEEIGQGELTFDLGVTQVTFRVLMPQEELEVQRYASEALSAETEDPNNAVDYLDRFRIACLSHAIVQVGGMDFRNVDYVSTGEKTESGVEIRVPRVKAIRSLVSRWSRAVLTRAFRKYSELSGQVEAKADQAIKYEPSDVDAEIERLEDRITELKARKEAEADKGRQEVFAHRMASVVEHGEAPARVAEALKPTLQEEAAPSAPVVSAPAPVPPPARRTGSIIPQQAVPPAELPEQAQPLPVPPRADSSFINADDDDSANAAMEAEHLRILEMRRRAARGAPPMDEGSVLERVHPQMQSRRVPPHLAASAAEAETHALDVGAPATELEPTKDGIPVFALPAQSLDVPAARARTDPKVVNPATTGAVNPRFRPPPRP